MLALVASQFEGEAEEKENVETKYWFRIGEFCFVFFFFLLHRTNCMTYDWRWQPVKIVTSLQNITCCEKANKRLMSTFVSKTVCRSVDESLFFLLAVDGKLINLHCVLDDINWISLMICYQLARANLLSWKLSIWGKNFNYRLVLLKTDNENEKQIFEIRIKIQKWKNLNHSKRNGSYAIHRMGWMLCIWMENVQ